MKRQTGHHSFLQAECVVSVPSADGQQWPEGTAGATPPPPKHTHRPWSSSMHGMGAVSRSEARPWTALAVSANLFPACLQCAGVAERLGNLKVLTVGGCV
jgi:hypothetical protein